MTISPSEVTIRHFQPGDEAHFQKLNEEWITRYFVVESKDRASFSDPRKTIIEGGGRILFALKNGEIAGCCALLDMGAGQFEVAKMAVSASHQGAGIGRRLLEEIIAAARGLGASRLYLETNHVLGPAIGLYEAVGFRHLPAERIVPSPYARADVYMELFL
jgi:putative acetyltransferase